MEHKFYTDNFERLLKEKSDEFRMYPSKRVWHSIYNDLHPDRRWPSIAVSLVLVTILFLIGYWNNNLSGTAEKTAQQKIAAASIPGNSNTQNTTVAVQNKPAENAGTTANDPSSAGTVQTVDAALATGNPNQNSSTPHGNIAAANNSSNTVTAISTSSKTAKYSPGSAKNIAGKNAARNRNTGEASVVTASPDNINIKEHPQDNTTGAAALIANTAVTPKPAAEATAATVNKPRPSDKTTAGTGIAELLADEVTTTAINAPDNNTALPAGDNSKSVTEPALGGKPTVAKLQAAAGKLSAEDKSWIDNYAFYNRQFKNRWKGRLSSEIYFTPGASFRKLSPTTDFALAYNAVMGNTPSTNGNSKDRVTYHPGVTFEAGAGISYSIAKNIRIKAGVQANFTNYSIEATEMNHPVLTTLLLTDINTGFTYLEGRSSSLANIAGSNSKRIHNQTSQISLPVGLAVKLAGNGKLEWYAGAAVQPTYVFGGKANLISFDHKNYVADPSMIRSWNLNTAFETYIHYKLQGFTLAAGPELRYQVMSTYSKKYTYAENLYNIGLKIGIVKNF